MLRPTETFEEVVAWQKARELTRSIYSTTRQPMCAKDWGICAQIQRAAVSIMANIAEGFERGKPKEYLQFLSVAKASCAEVRSHLYVAPDSEYIDEETFALLSERAREIGRMLGGLRASIERRMSN